MVVVLIIAEFFRCRELKIFLDRDDTPDVCEEFHTVIPDDFFDNPLVCLYFLTVKDHAKFRSLENDY